MVSVFGGAVLERYLLPIVPIVYAAMALGLALFPRRPQRICATVLLAGVAASNFINPPYPFPYENNLAFVDFARLQYSAASYLERYYPESRVLTMWPLTVELRTPELGFVGHKYNLQKVANLSPANLKSVDWNQVQVAVAFSRDWDPSFSFMHYGPVQWFWERFFGYTPGGGRAQVRAAVPLRLETHMERRGQWVDIYVNPLSPGPLPVVRALTNPHSEVK
jgi:pimeloyl-ACP methyl ester carboxylesterase